MNMSVELVPFALISPFLSILVAESSEDIQTDDVHTAIIKLLISESDLNENYFADTERQGIGTLGHVCKTNYVIEKPPSWAPDSRLINLENHCFITFQVGQFFAFYFSEKGRKDEIRDYFSIPGSLESICPVSINHLYHNFVNEDEVKMLWLSDISGKSSFKVGSKVLGGDSVADALDPILDQFYMMSAVRTNIGAGEDFASIGINPFKSSIWRGPCQTWEDFESRVVELLDALNSRRDENLEPISILAYPIFDLGNVASAYDFTVMEFDALPASSPQRVRDLLERFERGYHFEQIQSLLPTQKITLDLYFNNEKCATYVLTPRLERHFVRFDVTRSYEAGKKTVSERIEQLFNKPELIKCWFESGHAIVGGMVFKTEYRDVQFDNFVWADFEDYDVFKEKPTDANGNLDLGQIGLQKSLFCWVKNLWTSNWQGTDDFYTTEVNRGWLYCDDGAGEKADFIHFDTEIRPPLLTFIHIKAANKGRNSDGSQRRLSVGAHDIVVNQAIKNIRYYDRKKLSEALSVRIEHSEEKACWFNNEVKPATEFLLNLSQTAEVKTRVVVIQPHTRKNCFDNTQRDNNVKRQLETLLVSTNNAITATNTEFFVLGSRE